MIGDETKPRIAIVGSGPTRLYTLAALIDRKLPCFVHLFEKGDRAGVGIPYSTDDNQR